MVKNIVSYIITMFLILFIIMIIVLNVFSNTILKKEYTIANLKTGNYYERINQNIVDGFKDYTVQSGLSDEVLEKIYSQDKLEQDINSMIESLYTGSKINIDTESIKENLLNNIEIELEKENKEIAQSEEEALTNYMEAIVEVYKNNVLYSEKVVEEIGTVLNKANNIINKAQIVIYLIPLVLVIILIVINHKQLKFLQYIGIGLLATGLFSITPKIISELKMDINNIMAINQATSNLIQTMAQDILNRFTVIGIIMIVIGIILIIIHNVKACRILEETKRSRH